MAIKATFKNSDFGVGDKVKVSQRIFTDGKEKQQVFEGVVIQIRGKEENKTFTVRKIGVQQIGIEKIFPLNEKVISEILVKRGGVEGARRAKLYYLRNKSRREAEKIFSRSSGKTKSASKK